MLDSVGGVDGVAQSIERVGVSARTADRSAASTAGRKPVMAQLDRIADTARLAGDTARVAVDRTRSGRHNGSVGLVLFVAVVLAAPAPA